MSRRPAIYRIKIGLDDVTPPIWRRLEVSSDTKLHEFHEVLVAAMGWNGAHLHAFLTMDGKYGPIDEAFPNQFADERATSLESVLDDDVPAMAWVYDFGDVWFHRITLEAALEPDEGVAYPRCTGGRRACPPDDCGGAAEFVHALAAWPPRFTRDPAAFNLGEINERLWSLERTMPGRPISDERIDDHDLDALETMFEGSDLSLSYVEGFLAAVASAPGLSSPTPYLQALLAKAGPAKDFSQIGLIFRWYNDINEALGNRRFASMIANADGKVDSKAAVGWAKGYRAAVQLDYDAWRPLLTGPDAHLFSPIEALSSGATHGRSAAIIALTDAAFNVFEYWRVRRIAMLEAMSAPSVPLRRAPKIGRNEPCPCGSGRKYKACCLKA